MSTALRDATEQIERAVLGMIAEGGATFGPTECFYPFATIMKRTGLSRDYVRAACRSLVDRGLAEYSNALSNEDGDFRGAGYAATPAGLAELHEQPLQCEECGQNPADLPSRICPGCAAYRDHTGHF